MSQVSPRVLGYAAVVSVTALAIAACGSNSSGSARMAHLATRTFPA